MHFTLSAAALLLLWPLSSTKDYPMIAGTDVPAAAGSVRVEKDKANGNVRIDVKVEHLANPSSLTPSATNYLVWVRPNGGDAIRQGGIRVNKDLNGELKAESVLKEFDVLITAEQSESALMPSSTVVLRAHVGPR